MVHDPRKHDRRSIRWFAYDYAQAGAYFVTTCVEDHACLLGRVEGEVVRLNELGLIVHEVWTDLPNHYQYLRLDAFVIMPNHVHMVVMLTDETIDVVGAGFKPAPTDPVHIKRHGLPEIVRALKTFSARRINEYHATAGTSFWQRNYYEHIIRDEQQLSHVRRYIQDNPANWAFDHENPQSKCFGQMQTLEDFTY